MIPDKDLKISSYPERKLGGQYCGLPQGVKIEHIPTGTIIIFCAARSQSKNKKIAMNMLAFALTDPLL